MNGHTVLLIDRARFHGQRTKGIVALIGGENDHIADGGADGFGIVAPQINAIRYCVS